MWIDIFFAITGLSAGLLISFGMFTVLFVIGMIPRFAGKTHTGDKIVWYEESVIWGSVLGGIFSIFYPWIDIERYFGETISLIALGVSGVFAGVFVGCLALAIGEMLNTIPIFTRRIGFRHGLGLAVTSMALGKFAGSLYYFMSGYGNG
ncbi:MAG: stage V sporulation protein AB [Lachnospiraceae bacterium]|nr:stage V sporulation protein AB [Lachnospiraceae bacterium]